MTTLDDLLNPRSIAIVGASDDPTRIGGRPLSHMINQRFDGGIYPVNPKRDRVQGLRAYPTLGDIDGDVDFVLVAVPAPMVAGQVRAAAEKKARTVMVFSSGFAEASEEGAALQEELGQIARDTGMRIFGPNCLGLFDADTGFLDRLGAVNGDLVIRALCIFLWKTCPENQADGVWVAP